MWNLSIAEFDALNTELLPQGANQVPFGNELEIEQVGAQRATMGLLAEQGLPDLIFGDQAFPEQDLVESLFLHGESPLPCQAAACGEAPTDFP
jgi:hypothetical protein